MIVKEITINTPKEWSNAVDALVHQNLFMQTYLKTTPFGEDEEELFEMITEMIYKGEDDSDAFIELDFLYCCFGNESSITDFPELTE